MKSSLRIIISFSISIGLLGVIQECKKPGLPVVTTSNVSDITQTSAISGGNVTNNGGADITARGVCWGITHNPALSNTITNDGRGNGAYSSRITGLSPNTTYYVRAYATNSEGTEYGKELVFTTNAIPATVPGPPTIGTAIKGNAQASIAFTAPANDGGSALTGYTVTSIPGGFTGTGTTSPITVTGLTNGIAYTFTVAATNAIGTGPASAASNSVTPSTVPGAPTGISAAAGCFRATVSFSAPGNNGGSAITGYSVTSNPGGFTVTGSASPIIITNLTNGTAYTFIVVAINANGNSIPSAPSNSVTPSAPTSVTDRDGNIYNTVSIGTQVWLKANLKTTKLNDGTLISNVTDAVAWGALVSPAYCWYNNDINNKNIYGGLYNWYAVNTGKLCPTGWHVASSAEWNTMVLAIDPGAQVNMIEQSTIAGGKLKETGTSHWLDPNPATNETGFTALPGGMRASVGSDVGFLWINSWGEWYTSTVYSNGTVGERNIRYINSSIYKDNENISNKWIGLSVRCVMDN